MANELDIANFSIIDFIGQMDRGLATRFRMFATGRWTEKSLYALYREGLAAGNLEVALNLVGLMGDDLTPAETAAANRVYLMARARSLAEVKGQLASNAGQAKEAELLLKSVYGISDAEAGVIKNGLQVNILADTGTEKRVEIIDPEIDVELDDVGGV